MKQTYSKMKDSGVDTIGFIPTSWGTMKLKFLCEIMTGDQDTQDSVPDGIYPLYVRSSIVEKANKCTFEGEAILMAGDGVGAGKIFHHAFGKMAIHQRVYCLHNFHQINSNFLYYFVSNLFSLEIEKGSAKSTVASVRLPMLKDFIIAFPILEIQTDIANYLDAKCSEIDSIISEVKDCIEEYKNWKSSIISEAVTKGLDPNAKMKDSGVEWIGEIPEGWRIIKIKNVAYLDPSCCRPSDNCLVSFVPMECIRANQRIKKVSLLSADNASYSSFNNGDIALAKVSPCFENKNICTMSDLKNQYAFGSSELFNLRPFNVITNFLLYWLLTDRFIKNGVVYMTGVAGLKRIPSSYVKNAYITFPPIFTQTAIANYLDAKCAQIDEIISEKELLISDLESYKRSLICEIVTEKVRVSEDG